MAIIKLVTLALVCKSKHQTTLKFNLFKNCWTFQQNSIFISPGKQIMKNLPSLKELDRKKNFVSTLLKRSNLDGH